MLEKSQQYVNLVHNKSSSANKQLVFDEQTANDQLLDTTPLQQTSYCKI